VAVVLESPGIRVNSVFPVIAKLSEARLEFGRVQLYDGGAVVEVPSNSVSALLAAAESEVCCCVPCPYVHVLASASLRVVYVYVCVCLWGVL